MNTKKIYITIISFILLMIIIIFAFSKKTHSFTGILVENDFTVTAEMSIEYPRFYRWVGNENGYGSVIINSDKRVIQYKLIGDFRNLETVNLVGIVKYNEKINAMESGEIYFDKELNNIILEGEFCTFIAADEEFVDYVKGHYKY